MKKTLIIFAHPNMEESKLNKKLIEKAQGMENITINNLYANYKTYDDIDVKKEQELLLSHDRIVFQFPLFWFSSPGLLKDWQDKVLEYNFAHGSKGDKLKGKEFKIVTTTGSPEYSYQSGGYMHNTLNEILKPFETTVTYAQMIYTIPFSIYGALKITDEELEDKAQEYHNLLLEQNWSDKLEKYPKNNIKSN